MLIACHIIKLPLKEHTTGMLIACHVTKSSPLKEHTTGMLIACHVTKSSPLKEHTTGMLTELKFNGDCKFAWQYWHRQEEP